jgi:hypothetical protein
VISLLIVLALVSVPLALIARLSLTVLARLLGVVSQSEVTTRAEFARIREQLLATAVDHEQSPAPPSAGTAPGASAVAAIGQQREGSVSVHEPAAENAAFPSGSLEWRSCSACGTDVPSTASLCLQCGARLART